MLAMMAGLAVASATGDEPAAPPVSGRGLLDLLRQDEEARTIEDRIRHTKASMSVLLAADRDVLFAAFDCLVAEPSDYDQRQRIMLVRQCARKDAAAAAARLETIQNPDTYCIVANAVWGTIAREDPDRAAAAVQKLYEPTNLFNRATLQTPGRFHGLVHSIMREVGEEWFRREGLDALKKIGTLRHADDMDDALFRGFCDAATNAEQRLALLDWMAGPNGKFLDRWQKGSKKWYEVMLAEAAREDRAAVKAWLERRYPVGKARRSDNASDWDMTRFRHAFFRVWAESDRRQAADWLVAQHGNGDKDMASSFSLCIATLSAWPHGSLAEAADWLVQYQTKELFVEKAHRILRAAATVDPQRDDLESVCARFAELPLALRARIFFFSTDDVFDPVEPGIVPDDPRLLPGLFPDDKERQKIEEKWRKQEAARANTEKEKGAQSGGRDKEDRYYWEAFDLKENPPAPPAPAPLRELAKSLAAQYDTYASCHDPQKRLEGLAALEWLARATNSEFADVLIAHLENTRGEYDEFADMLVKAWAERDWEACEKFAWEAGLHVRTRNTIMATNFERAAMARPDEILARLKTLIAEGRLDSKSLDSVGMGPGQGDPAIITGYAFIIPRRLGEGWIVRDGAAAIEKIKSLPARWVPSAALGAAEAFRSGEAGIALLEWNVGENDNHARTIFSRLVTIDFEAAKRWLEASPERLAKSEESFRGFSYVCREFFRRDPVAAAEWARRVRPDQNVTWLLIQALVEKDEAKALAWLDAHPDDPGYDTGLNILVEHWELTKPAEAAKLVARMKNREGRINVAADLVHTWSRLDKVAAHSFLDDTFGKSSPDRKTIEAELTRLDNYARDKQKR